MKKIEIILSEKTGILPNLQASLEIYEACPLEERKIWEAEFNIWYNLMAAQSRSVAEKYRNQFDMAKKIKFDLVEAARRRVERDGGYDRAREE